MHTYICMYMATGHDYPYLISLTFSGEILIHSLPSLGEVTMIPYELPVHDIRYSCVRQQ